ncbi:hypothetical protein PIROE2DRAFT_65437, partial [Piromyces sp. E2]
ISIIDIQKNGNAKINTRAREAIRFLEQYSIKPNKFLKIQKNEERHTVNYEEFYIFKDQEENNNENEDEEMNDISDESKSDYVKNIFEDSEINNENNQQQQWNRNKESELNDEMMESISYYRNQKPSRKYRSLIECINYYYETAKNEIAHITNIDNNIEDENISPLILVTNNRILLKYCEIYQIDCKCMSLQEFIKFMAVKRQEKRKYNNVNN